MRRILIAPDLIHQGVATIGDSDTLHHLLHVLRVSLGDRLQCSDGEGHRYTGLVTRCASHEVRLELQPADVVESAGVKLWLAQALIKPERLEWTIQKATELGMDRFTPLLTAHTVVRPSPSRLEHRLDRWHRIAKEAARQSGRTTLPTIDSPQSFEACLDAMAHLPLIVMPTLLVETVTIGEVVARAIGVREAALLIGPEGDFTHAEVCAAQSHGVKLVSLGRLTLRSETAALATLAILSHLLNTP